jgi:hypothetical protein
MYAPVLGRLGELPVRINDEFVCERGRRSIAILGLSPQASGDRVGSNTIDLAEKDFGLLAAIGPSLPQFSVASRL